MNEPDWIVTDEQFETLQAGIMSASHRMEDAGLPEDPHVGAALIVLVDMHTARRTLP